MELAGRTLTLETGRVALQADGAVTIRFGDTVVLSTVVMAEKGNAEADFFPLTVDFQERYYASGKIKGSRFIKREGRPSDEATLKARLIDRPIRPMFPKGITNEVQAINTILSADLENNPGIIALTGTSMAMLLAGLPFDGPIAGVSIGLVDGELVVMPTEEQIQTGNMDLTVAGTIDAITMVEAGANEVDEETFLRALDLAHKTIKEICEFQLKFRDMFSPEKREYTVSKSSDEMLAKVKEAITEEDFARVKGMKKKEVKAAMHALQDKVLLHFQAEIEAGDLSEGDVLKALQKLVDLDVRDRILTKGLRLDGRGLDDVRPIYVEIDLLPRTHGSALFQRGETQALTITTLGGPGAAQIIDTMDEDKEKRYIHYYNFPPYSTGEIKRAGSVSRREIGHGFLAERALKPMIPPKEEFPYTMLLNSEITTCNGSSSMASVCGSTLSLMAAGVPIKKPVAGIAMGLVTSDQFKETGQGDYKILTDIQGFEDFAGDMDFKVTGTADGITALQMDIKVKGITIEMMREALSKAKIGRAFIMSEMLKVLPSSRTEMSDYAPRITSMMIDPDFIRDVIGKGGETIQKISAQCEVEIDIEQNGLVTITSQNQEGAKKAEEWIHSITYVPQAGDEFDGTVVNLQDFGCFVEFLPGKDGLVHISRLRPYRVNNVEDVVKLGDKVRVKLLEIDKQGRYNLSMKEFYQDEKPKGPTGPPLGGDHGDPGDPGHGHDGPHAH